MITFQVNDMTCGHCAGVITRAITAVDKDARLDIRIAQKLVQVSSTAPAVELAEAIRGAGYTPQEVLNETPEAAPQQKTGGCGCGCGPRVRQP